MSVASERPGAPPGPQGVPIGTAPRRKILVRKIRKEGSVATTDEGGGFSTRNSSAQNGTRADFGPLGATFGDIEVPSRNATTGTRPLPGSSAPGTPPEFATERAVAPRGPKQGTRGKREEWTVLGDVDEYEFGLASAIESERLKRPPPPEFLPELPVHLHQQQVKVEFGKFHDHYSRAYRAITERRDLYAETAHHLRTANDASQKTHNDSINQKAHTGWQLHCKTRDEAHTRALDKWDAQRETWEALKQQQSIKFDKRPGDLAMERLDEHRRKIEVMQHLEMAAPIQEREGGAQWEWRMSLRNNWTRTVAVGNVFSELYYVRDELAFADPEHVRRATGAKDGQSYSASTGRSVLKSEHLANRRNRLKKRVANLLLGELAEEDVEMMELVGEGLLSVASREADKKITFEDLEEEIASASIETWAEIQKIKSDAKLLIETSAAKRAAELEKREIERLAKLGPHAVLDAYRLSARVEVSPADFLPASSPSLRKGVTVVSGGTSLAGLHSEERHNPDPVRGDAVHVHTTLRNTGSTALFYQWVRDTPQTLPGRAVPPVSSAWFLAQREGSLRPGESRKIHWTFKAHAPGVYTDGWRLLTKPELRRGPLELVSLRGVAFAEDPHSFPRRALAEDLAAREMRSKIASVLARVVHNITTPDRTNRNASKPPRVSEWASGGAPASGPSAAAFNANNVGRRPRVFFHEDVFGEMARIWDEAVALQTAMPVPEGEEEEEEKEEVAEGNADGEEGEVTEKPSWGDWDGSLAAVELALDSLQKHVDVNPDWAPTPAEPVEPGAEGEEAPEVPPPPLASETLEALRKGFASAVAQSLVPESRADLLAHSMTEVLCTLLDGIDTAARRARRAHEPRPVVLPEPKEGEEGKEPKGEEAEEGAEKPPEPEPRWMRKYRKQLGESIFAMLGDAIDTFEGPSDAGYGKAVTEVSKETDRRAKLLERTAGQRRRALRFGSAFDDGNENSTARFENAGSDKGSVSGGDEGFDDDVESLDGVSSDLDSGDMQSADGAAWEAFEMRRRQRALTRRDPGEGA